MLTFERDERDLLVGVHRWARNAGWMYDATTMDGCVTDFRWRLGQSKVVVTVDHQQPTPWHVVLDVPGWAHAEFDAAELQPTLDVLVALGALPPGFGTAVTQDRVVAAARVHADTARRAANSARAFAVQATRDATKATGRLRQARRWAVIDGVFSVVALAVLVILAVAR